MLVTTSYLGLAAWIRIQDGVKYLGCQDKIFSFELPDGETRKEADWKIEYENTLAYYHDVALVQLRNDMSTGRDHNGGSRSSRSST